VPTQASFVGSAHKQRSLTIRRLVTQHSMARRGNDNVAYRHLATRFSNDQCLESTRLCGLGAAHDKGGGSSYRAVPVPIAGLPPVAHWTNLAQDVAILLDVILLDAILLDQAKLVEGWRRWVRFMGGSS